MEQLEHASPLVDLVNALLGPFGIHVPNYLVFCALIVLFLAALGLFIRSRLSVDNPGKLQIVLEDIVGFIVEQLENLCPTRASATCRWSARCSSSSCSAT